MAVFAVDGAPSTTRTCDLLDRNQTLYPTELWARFKSGAEAYRIGDDSEYLAERAVCSEPASGAIPDLQRKYREIVQIRENFATGS